MLLYVHEEGPRDAPTVLFLHGLSDLRKVEPEAIGHFIQEMTKIQLPREGQVPTLIAVGQQEE